MTGIWVGAGFFAFVLTAVALAGYCYQRLAERRDLEGSGPNCWRATGKPLRARPSRICSSPSARTSPPPRTNKIPTAYGSAAAGYRWPSALPIFYGIKCGSALFFAGLLGILALLYQHDPALTPLPMICGLGIGFLLPDRVLSSRVRARAQRLRSAIPPALDLMVLAMEAGPGAGSIHRRRQPRPEAHAPGLERASSRSFTWS